MADLIPGLRFLMAANELRARRLGTERSCNPWLSLASEGGPWSQSRLPLSDEDSSSEEFTEGPGEPKRSTVWGALSSTEGPEKTRL